MKEKNRSFGYRLFIPVVLLMGIYLHSKTPTPPPLPLNTQSDYMGWSWLSRDAVPPGQVTRSLNEIWGLSKEKAKEAAYGLRAAWEKASIEGKHAACLLIAVALDRAKEDRLARLTYEQIKKEAEDLPYAKSAAFRLRFLDEPGLSKAENLEKVYKIITNETSGWFLLPKEKKWIMPQEALQPLLDLRAHELSFGFFKYLWSQSLFPVTYSY